MIQTHKQKSRLSLIVFVGVVLASAFSMPAVSVERARKTDKRHRGPAASIVHPLNSELLPALLKKRGYNPGPHFMGLVVAIVPNSKDSFEYYPYDYKRTSLERDTWWPASTVKLFAAIAALEKARHLGFSSRAELTFHYDDGDVTRPLRSIVEKAITLSNNRSFDKLVEFVGFDGLNKGFFTKKNGFKQTVMLRSYTGRWRYEDTEHGSNRHSPPITIVGRNGKTLEIEARHGKGTYDCKDQGNCTTLAELSLAMRRVMMHEHLPEGERFFLGKGELALLRYSMKRDRPKGHGGVVTGLEKAFSDRAVEFYHKGGYAYEWLSDNVFVKALDTGEKWLVALANHPGRAALDEAAEHVGHLLAEGAFAKARMDTASTSNKEAKQSTKQCVHAFK